MRASFPAHLLQDVGNLLGLGHGAKRLLRAVAEARGGAGRDAGARVGGMAMLASAALQAIQPAGSPWVQQHGGPARALTTATSCRISAASPVAPSSSLSRASWRVSRARSIST